MQRLRRSGENVAPSSVDAPRKKSIWSSEHAKSVAPLVARHSTGTPDFFTNDNVAESAARTPSYGPPANTFEPSGERAKPRSGPALVSTVRNDCAPSSLTSNRSGSDPASP